MNLKRFLKAKSPGRGVIFWKNLSLVLLITCIPMALIGIILYVFGTDRLEQEVKKAHEHKLSQSMQQMNEYFSSLENIVIRVAFDQSLDETLSRMDFVGEFTKTKELLQSFALMKQSNSLINSVALYVPDSEKILGDEAGLRSVQSPEDRRVFRSLLEHERIIYWNYSLKKINQPESSHKAIVIRLPGWQMYDSFGAFLIYLDQNNLNRMINQLAPGEGAAFLFNENGVDLAALPGGAAGSDTEALRQALGARILGESPAEGHFPFSFSHQNYSVSYGKISKFGGKWTVVFATPLSQIVAPVTSLSNVILWISALGLTLGLLLSWIASNRIYAPISRLRGLFEATWSSRPDARDEIEYIEKQWKQHLREREELSARIRQSIPALRESFMLQFLQGHLYAHTEEEIYGKLRQLEWDVENERFAVLVAQLHGISEPGGKFAEHDAQLVSFAASNIITELGGEKFHRIHVVSFQDLSVGAFLALDERRRTEETKAMLEQLAQDIIGTLNNVLRMRVTIVIGKITEAILEVPDILEQTRKALRFRDLHASNQMLDMNHFSLEDSPRSTFPSELERGIVHAVSLGLEEEAVRLIRAFISELQRSYGTELMVHQGVMKLLGAIHEMMIRQGVNLVSLYEGVHLYEQLLRIQEPDEMIDWFRYKLIRPFIGSLTLTYDGDLKEIVDRLLVRMQEEYMNDVSLEMYADRLGMSPSRLSKAFRQMTGVNFIDYLVRLRVEKCKELLCTTDMKISEIAQQLHYHPSYLIRMFKKLEGVTPGQYREKQEQPSHDMP